MEPTLDLMRHIAGAAGLEMVVAIRETDPDERKARLAARSLTDEERLRQNDNLSRLAASSGEPRDD